ncbi:hypothetical protein TUM4644_17110 [Shewanella colwelliana]|uniref:hypothetical protein n=1 Tax=Shewanella colwelliana TaxID=23 RepID=UPI001BC0C7D9|nr:hypothetical protein [Shewanella colwelliana]GIU23524.1 hypothetical protein TUM4644_17110 [Shewanella colwelliana]
MRFYYSSILLLTVLTVSSAIAHGRVETLDGAWSLQSGQYLDENQQWVDYQSRGLTAIKVIAGEYFSFTTMQQSEANAPTFWVAASGRLVYDDTTYTEYPTLNSFDASASASFSFEYQLEVLENGQIAWHTKRIENGELKELEVWLKR